MWPLDPPDIFGVDDGLLSLASGGIIYPFQTLIALAAAICT